MSSACYLHIIFKAQIPSFNIFCNVSGPFSPEDVDAERRAQAGVDELKGGGVNWWKRA